MFRNLPVVGTSITRLGQILCIVLLAPLISSCTRYEVEDHSFQFNQAIGSLGNRLLLLNAVRAAKGYPMQFSKLQAYTGQGRADGSLQVDIPFLLDVVGTGALAPTRLIGTAKPNASARTGVQALQLVDLNIAEAQKALRTQATGRDLEYYLLQGWPTRLVMTVMVEGVKIPETFFHRIAQTYEDECRARPDNPRCALRDKVRSCIGSKGVASDGVSYVTIANDVRSRCSFMRFQWFLDALSASGGTFHLARKKTKDKSDGKKQNAIYRSDKFAIDVNVKLPEKDAPDTPASESLELFFQDAALEKFYRDLRRMKDLRGNSVEVLEFLFRSPERMVRFLGDIIAVQELANEPWEITIRHGDYNVELFKVNRGLTVNAAVAVVEPEGERFFIPIPDHGSPTKHLSLQTLTFVMDFLNSAVSGKSLPPPNTLLISGG